MGDINTGRFSGVPAVAVASRRCHRVCVWLCECLWTGECVCSVKRRLRSLLFRSAASSSLSPLPLLIPFGKVIEISIAAAIGRTAPRVAEGVENDAQEGRTAISHSFWFRPFSSLTFSFSLFFLLRCAPSPSPAPSLSLPAGSGDTPPLPSLPFSLSLCVCVCLCAV